MKGMREIRTRIKAVKNTAQITRAMQLVASSKMKKAQDMALKSRTYAYGLAELLNSLSNHVKWNELKHKLLEKREVKSRGILLVTSDKGLCGSLNQNIFKSVGQFSSADKFIALGQKGLQFLSRTNRNVLGHFSFHDSFNFKDVQNVVHFAIDAFESEKIDTVEVLFPRFKNTLVQEPFLRRLLPIINFSEELDRLAAMMDIDADKNVDKRPLIIEPDAETILDKLPALFVKKSLYQILLEAKASEHSSRMVAMKSATDNADQLIESLLLEYNKARQASITQEIVEITASSGQTQ